MTGRLRLLMIGLGLNFGNVRKSRYRTPCIPEETYPLNAVQLIYVGEAEQFRGSALELAVKFVDSVKYCLQPFGALGPLEGQAGFHRRLHQC